MTRFRSKVSQMQGLVEAAERARHEQEKGARRQVDQAREVKASVKSLSGKTDVSESIVTHNTDRQTDRHGDSHVHVCLCINTAKLEQELAEREEKISELRHALEMLDKDHDALRAEADGKDERIAQLRKQLSEQVRGGGLVRRKEGRKRD